jgi:DNA-binding response OmpR family regulator
MPVVVIFGTSELGAALDRTVLRRQEYGRHVAESLEAGLRTTRTLKPALVILDRDFAQATAVVKEIRQDPATRQCSLAVVARGDFQPAELELLELGANAVLRLPVNEEWDTRLARLLAVNTRRETRVPIHIQLQATLGPEDPFTAETVNISETGMLVHSATVLGLGRDVDFAFQLPRPAGLVSGRARVVRFGAPGEFGLQFVDLDEDVLGRLRSFLQGRSGF